MRKQCESCCYHEAFKYHERYGFLCDYCADGLNFTLPAFTAFYQIDEHYYDQVIPKKKEDCLCQADG